MHLRLEEEFAEIPASSQQPAGRRGGRARRALPGTRGSKASDRDAPLRQRFKIPQLNALAEPRTLHEQANLREPRVRTARDMSWPDGAETRSLRMREPLAAFPDVSVVPREHERAPM